MMGHRRRAIGRGSMVLALGLFLSGCGGERTFERGDLAAIVLTPGEVPGDVEPRPFREGSVALGGLWGTSVSSKVQRELLDGGFSDAARSWFETRTLTGPDSVIVVSAAILFEDADSAKRGRDLTVEGFMGDEGTPTEIPADGLGDEARGVRGLFTPENPELTGLVFVWRVGNLVLVCYGAGATDEGELRDLAERMNERTI